MDGQRVRLVGLSTADAMQRAINQEHLCKLFFCGADSSTHSEYARYTAIPHTGFDAASEVEDRRPPSSLEGRDVSGKPLTVHTATMNMILNVDRCHMARLEVNQLGFRVSCTVERSTRRSSPSWEIGPSENGQAAAKLPGLRHPLARIRLDYRMTTASHWKRRSRRFAAPQAPAGRG